MKIGLGFHDVLKRSRDHCISGFSEGITSWAMTLVMPMSLAGCIAVLMQVCLEQSETLRHPVSLLELQMLQRPPAQPALAAASCMAASSGMHAACNFPFYNSMDDKSCIHLQSSPQDGYARTSDAANPSRS